MKSTKKDKQFSIQFDQSNRDFISNTALSTLTLAVSLVSLLISAIAIVIAIRGIDPYSIWVTIILGSIAILFSVRTAKKVKKMLNDTKDINDQLQKTLFEIYPEYKSKHH